jgi:hypothetical protein
MLILRRPHFGVTNHLQYAAAPGPPAGTSARFVRRSGSPGKHAPLGICSPGAPKLLESADRPQAPSTQIVLLGTGTPSPDPERSGPTALLDEVRQLYSGKVVTGHDLDIF